MKSKILTALFLCFTAWGMAQSKSKEGYIWYFGMNAGVDFNEGIAISLPDGKLATDEGCATIADKEGKLLFYTDGMTVYNRNHEVMENGSDLKGNYSATSSAVVIPAPAREGFYYVFTVDATAGLNGFCYSLVDISANEGQGKVVSELKNIKLADKVTEKLTAVRHRNGKDSWVIVHEWQSDKFKSFLVTKDGVQAQPVISQVGKVHTGGTLNTQGYMKSNPDGTNIAVALEEEHLTELFDFDTETGKVSNPILIPQIKGAYSYGVEFSPNGSLLYVSAPGTGEIYQYNLQNRNPQDIVKSAVSIGKTPNNEWIGALQIAADGKIYFPIYGTSFLGVIHEPNVVGKNCSYENNYAELDRKIARLGLPTFSQSFFETQTVEVKTETFDNKKIETGKDYILENVFFETAKYDLKTTSFAELDKVVKIMKDNPNYSVLIKGHTDNVGNKSANLILSDNRAQSVGNYLISKGISKDKITFKGFGSQVPVADNANPEGRAKNRRVELSFNK